MLRYIIKRIFIFIPTLMLISLITFGLSRIAPGDPAQSNDSDNPKANWIDDKIALESYQRKAHDWGLDKPVFYFSLTSKAFPDTLYRITYRERRETLQNLIAQYGNWNLIDKYYHQIEALDLLLAKAKDSIAPDERIYIRRAVKQLYIQYQNAAIVPLLDTIQRHANTPMMPKSITKSANELKNDYQEITSKPDELALQIPSFRWYGSNNQYHHWLINCLKGDFGFSYISGRSVLDEIGDAIGRTLIINTISIVLIYFLAIKTGKYLYRQIQQNKRNWLQTMMLMLFATPNFLMAIFLLMFLTTPDFGIQIFPSTGWCDLADDAPFWERALDIAWHLVLPIFCVSYLGWIVLSRQLQSSLQDTSNQDYITTARAKGLSEKAILNDHAMKNAIFPLVTAFAQVFPALISGSVIIEHVFGIHGMGDLAYTAALERNWPIVLAVVMLGALLTLIGNLVADILYAYFNPRVTLN